VARRPARRHRPGDAVGGFGADKEVALALREPVGAALRRIRDRQPDPQRPDLGSIPQGAGHTRRQLSVTVDDTGTVTWTTVLGQTRTVTPYDYRTDDAREDDPPPY
jgi:hypothetical protein